MVYLITYAEYENELVRSSGNITSRLLNPIETLSEADYAMELWKKAIEEREHIVGRVLITGVYKL